MRSQLINRLAVALLLLCAAIGACTAKALQDDDALAIEQVIRAQMAAFAKDDAASAFQLSSPGIQTLFHHNASNFLNSVKEGYQPVYRPGDVFFLKAQQRGERIVQPVKIGTPDGKVWIAYYQMQRQPDKNWRIDGCQLEMTDDVST
jgi:hypothetical protein